MRNRLYLSKSESNKTMLNGMSCLRILIAVSLVMPRVKIALRNGVLTILQYYT